jgi:small subunit ribosomal protein S18
MNQNYELYLILSPLLDAKETDAQIQKIQQVLETEMHATDVKIEKEGVRRMAYPIKKQWNGFYVLITFDLNLTNTSTVSLLEKRINLMTDVQRYIVVNQTEYLKQLAKDNTKETEITYHRELNKGKKKKQCIVTHMNKSAIDYKDVEFLNQFTSPYAKIFGRSRTGTKSKYHRKVTRAIKRARHMALMPFTTKWMD